MTAIVPQLAPLDGPTLVEASAGTGKTYTITTYFVREILEKGRTPEQILVVTYTKAATAELRVRARKRIVDALDLIDAPADHEDVLRGVVAETVARIGREETEEALRAALATMDRAVILTIHAFCQRLLQDYPLRFGIDFDFEVAEDSRSIQEDLAVDFWVSELYQAPDWLLRALAKEGVTIKRLTKLAGMTSMPNVGIRGPDPIDVDAAQINAWLELKEQTAALWRDHRDEVTGILLEDPG